MKLYSKLTRLQGEIKNMIQPYGSAMSLEVQQRACEYMKLIASGWDSHLSAILESIPKLDMVSTNFQE
jgi:hypothetical protein